MKRIGIMGGTFDPIHIGHLILAKSAYEQLFLDKVLFIPAGNPPHKPIRPGCGTNEQRLDMVRLAVEDEDAFEVDTIEMDSEEESYSYKTLQKLKQRDPDTDYYFIIGQDSLINFRTWRKPEEIVKLAHIAAADRPGYDTEAMKKITDENVRLFGGDFIIFECPDIQISSSMIRERIGSGLDARFYVPESVNEYILRNNMYL